MNSFQRSILGVLITLFVATEPAGAVEIYNNCKGYVQAGYYLTGESRIFRVQNWSDSDSVNTEVHTKHVFRYPNNPTFQAECDIRDYVESSLGALPRSGSFLDDFTPSGGWVNALFEVGCIGLTIAACAAGPTPVCVASAFFCGGLVRELNEHSPDWITILSDRPLGVSAVVVAFSVANIGDGDWLSMQVNGEEFWHQPLSDFQQDEVYYAIVPEVLLKPDRADSFFFYLGSTGQSNARVLFSSSATPLNGQPACANGLDDDGDGKIDFNAVTGQRDFGCSDAIDPSEMGIIACDDGFDNDRDGRADYRKASGAGDLGCASHRSVAEVTVCQDGVDNDLSLGIDFDGGASVNGGVAIDVPDPQCTAPTTGSEAPPAYGCGIGPELALLMPGLIALRRRRANSARPRSAA